MVVGERTSEVQVGAEYGGKYLEQGTPGGKIKPRPFLAPSAEEQRPLFVRDMMEAVRQAAREAVREAVGKLG
ncbi:MAG: hypothetical protein A2V59_06800 [Armatimonadetes bacterium RBG_19FT_COMBO_69_19]|nr:MAG: hypothetical protein A2V59_06800 [Armatimonadetes bacterium RBG_19FT_COMBO_69_19]